ncbi:MAG TPA: glycoside hydrolase family 140 protein [Fimbriimonadaceae bacterium]|nr:glycoside hydrolase family 140 protein [Fimbriimonadaceae bacterium]
MQRLRVSDDGRFLATQDGEPFFWLGDTAWEIFHRLTREEAMLYLETRKRQGFNVIQAVALAELEGLTAPNRYGQLPFLDQDPHRPDEEGGYWEYVEQIVGLAEGLGLYVALLPTWGDKIKKEWGVGPEIFDEARAEAYGRWIGQRLGHRENIVWVNGGDRDAGGVEHIFDALGRGIRAGEPWRHLMTHHPNGGHSSSEWFHRADWLDFNMMQSGHWIHDIRSDLMIEKDYALDPVKPVLDGEPNYENHPPFKDFSLRHMTASDVRQSCYWSVFAGGCGVTYGCNAVWQFASERAPLLNGAVGYWIDSLELPGANQIRFLKHLMLQRPYFDRIPDQTLISLVDEQLPIRATRDRAGTYLFAYLPRGGSVTVHADRLPAKELEGWWYDPRTGECLNIGRLQPRTMTLEAPGFAGFGRDWVLVLDDVAAGFEPPGLVVNEEAIAEAVS